MTEAPTPWARPADVTPWSVRRSRSTLIMVIASVLPAIVSWHLMKSAHLSALTTMTLAFLPLQVVSGALATTLTRGRRRAVDSAMHVVVVLLSVLVLVLLGSVVVSVVKSGYRTMSAQFLFFNDTYVSPSTSLDYGGVGHAIVGSAVVVGLATVLAVPLGLAVAVFLTESESRWRNLVRFLSQSMSGLPSVVAGLFIYSLFVVTRVSRPIGLLGSLALVILMLPTIVRTAEEVLKLTQGDLRSAALALGATRVRAFFLVMLPVARTGLVTALLLGVARVVGETAPLLLTAGLSQSTNADPLHGSMSTLTTYAYTYFAAGYDTSRARAWGSALVLLALVGILFASARLLSARRPGDSR